MYYCFLIWQNIPSTPQARFDYHFPQVSCSHCSPDDCLCFRNIRPATTYQKNFYENKSADPSRSGQDGGMVGSDIQGII